MNKLLRTHRLPCLLSLTLTVCCGWGTVWAEDGKWAVKPGDTMGNIVTQQYPGYANRAAIMQAIIKANPDAFIKNDLNRLVIGRTLTLPDAKSIPDLQPPVIVPDKAANASADTAASARLKELESQLAQLQDHLKSLESENTTLKTQVEGSETDKQHKSAELSKLEARIKELEQLNSAKSATPAPSSDAVPKTVATDTTSTADLDALKTELEASQQALTKQQQATDELKQQVTDNQKQADDLHTQVADLTRQNDTLQNDLKQAQAVATAAQKNAENSSSLPWILLGLLTLFILPLLWLLKRKRDEPSIATVPSPSKPVEPPSVITPTVDVTAKRAIPEETMAVSAPLNLDTQPSVAALEPVNVATVEEIPAPPENPDVDMKLDIARAYLDLRDSAAAADMLQEVLLEGGSRQRQDAREILSFIT
jgi:FimV-like protein